jgi:hypothetical protein
MAGTINSNMVVYNEQISAGLFEISSQYTDAFNASSQGALVMTVGPQKGNFEQEAFFKNVPELIRRRRVDTNAGVASKLFTMDELVNIKLNRGAGPVDWVLQDFVKAGLTTEAGQFVLGQQIGKQLVEDQLNTLILSVATALSGVAGATFDATGETVKTTTSFNLNKGNAKLGDRSGDIAVYVMHSGAYHDLIGSQITDKTFSQGTVVSVYQGIPGTNGRPVVVTDSPALIEPATSASGSVTKYITLGLTRNAGLLRMTEPMTSTIQTITGLENIVARYQGEYAFNIGVKGFAWLLASSPTINPTDQQLATNSNWVQKYASVKDLAGVRIVTQAA